MVYIFNALLWVLWPLDQNPKPYGWELSAPLILGHVLLQKFLLSYQFDIPPGTKGACNCFSPFLELYQNYLNEIEFIFIQFYKCQKYFNQAFTSFEHRGCHYSNMHFCYTQVLSFGSSTAYGLYTCFRYLGVQAIKTKNQNDLGQVHS